jgi:predicted RND superfamily exporter protein
MMPAVISPLEAKLKHVFAAIIAKRRLIVVLFALVTPPAAWFATKVPQDNSLDRLIVQSDQLFVQNKQFEGVFGHGEYVLLLVDAPDPFAPDVLRRFDQLELALGKLKHVSPSSALNIFKRAKGGFDGSPAAAEAFRKFAGGTELFGKQGLVSANRLAIPLILDVTKSLERQAVVEAIDETLAPYREQLAPFTGLHVVGQPYVNAYLDSDTRKSGMKYFPLFFAFVLLLNWTLYRSFRALFAFVITLAVSVALTMGYLGVTGGVMSIVSQMLPMTVLITCTATMVYLHSRYVEIDDDCNDIEEHQAIALANKFVAVTASIFATAVGFAALAVSQIRPIRELGSWVAVGLVFTWITVFTLFPALQRLLNTPTQKERKVAGQWFAGFVRFLPPWSYRYRWLLVPGSLLLCGAGGVALFGLGKVVAPMELETNAVEYIPHDTPLYQDTKLLEQQAHGGLSITEIWLRGKPGMVSDAPVLLGLEHFSQSLEADPRVSTVIGPTLMLKSLRYVSGEGDTLPEDPDQLESIAGTLETLLPREPLLSRFVDKKLAQTHLSVVTKTVDAKGFEELDKLLNAKWQAALTRDPALRKFDMAIVGIAPLQAKIAQMLVPTLVESFGLTVAIIFTTFLLVFRSGAARVMAMIPSLFAILVMFLVMRLCHMHLNVATILIASTVLGTSENDQIHFFYHFQEARNGGSTTEEALRHTLAISGRAIFFATIINAGGFVAFAFSSLPPIKQFGILSALAFLLSMIADFTALPAALWMVFREQPDQVKKGRSEERA